MIHGGAGTLFKGRLDPERETQARAGLTAALLAGQAVLEKSALDAVEQAVRALEDCPVFNAGRGAVYSHEGEQHMDAAIMSGQNREAGAVAGIQRVRNPITLARKVLSHSQHILLIGQGAEQFAKEQNCTFAEDDYFHSDYRWQQLLAIREQHTTALDHGIGLGTVGAVALDSHGHLAAATSTGGMTNKRYGRVGDSPLIGCGTYADDRCAVSATGHGEYFIRSAFAYDIAARMRYAQMSLAAACKAALNTVAELGGGGGVIAIDADGNFSTPFNTGRMYRGAITNNGSPEVDIY